MAEGLLDPHALLEAASQHIRDEEHDEGLQKATEARDLLEAAGDKDAALEAVFQIALANCSKDNRKEANRIVQEQLTTCREQGDRRGEAKMLVSAAWVNSDKRGKEKRQMALEWAEQARDMCQELDMKKDEATCLLILTNLKLKHKDDLSLMEESAEAALNLIGGAVLLCRGIGDRRGEANTLHWLAVAQNWLGKQEALETSAEAAKIFMEVGDEMYASNEYRQLAGWHIQISCGDLEEATRCAEEALDIVRLRKRATNVREVSTLGVLCRTHVARQNLPEALRLANEGIERFKQQGDKKAETDVRLMMVQSHFRNSDIDDSKGAQVLAEEALEGYKSLDSKNNVSKVSSLAALVSFKSGDFQKARAYAESVLQMTDKEIVDEGVAKHVLIGCNLVEKNFEEALRHGHETQAMCVEEGKPIKEAITLLTICNVYFQMEDYQNAMKCARESQALFFEEGERSWEAEAHQAQSEIHQARQEHQAAVRAAEKAGNTWRALGEAKELAHSLVLAAQNQALLLVKKFEARHQDAPTTTELKVGAKKAITMAKEAQELARHIGDQSTLASALCAAAQAEVLDNRYNQALDATTEAIQIYREMGDARLLANALVLSARTRLVAGWADYAPEEATEALALFRQCNDAKGEALAIHVYESIREANLNVGAARTAPVRGGEIAAPVTEVASAASAQPKGLDPDVIIATIQDVTKKLVGGNIDLEAERPLMEAGVTSMTAILYRQNLAAAIGGVNFPVTLVFDYPSVSAIADFVLEQSAVLGGSGTGFR